MQFILLPLSKRFHCKLKGYYNVSNLRLFENFYQLFFNNCLTTIKVMEHFFTEYLNLDLIVFVCKIVQRMTHRLKFKYLLSYPVYLTFRTNLKINLMRFGKLCVLLDSNVETSIIK